MVVVGDCFNSYLGELVFNQWVSMQWFTSGRCIPGLHEGALGKA